MNVASIKAFDIASQKVSKLKHVNFSSSSDNGVRNTTLPSINGANALANINSAKLYMLEAVKKSPNTLAISFTGNGKNIKQIASIGPENAGLKMNYVYSQGGLGVVARELPDALKEYSDITLACFTPCHCPGIKRAEGAEIEGGLIRVMEEIYGASESNDNKKVTGRKFKTVGTNYKLKNNETFVIHTPLNTKTDLDNLNVGFIKLKPTGIKGSVKAVSSDLGEMKSFPYVLFEADIFSEQEKAHKAKQYIVHVPGMDEWSKAYNIGAQDAAKTAKKAVKETAKKVDGAYSGGLTEDYFYSVFNKAANDAIKQMSTNEEFIKRTKENGEEIFNPANYMLHDRQSYMSALDIADRSSKGDEYFQGMRMEVIAHNPTPAYQGSYENPLDFFKIVGNEDQLNDLKLHHKEDYEELFRLNDKILKANKQGNYDYKQILTPDEIKRTKEILDPYIGHFKDDSGAYNLTKIATQMVREGNNTKLVTVSENFAKEMREPGKTGDIGGAMANEFEKTEIVGITNGITPANMGFEKDGKIGKGILNSDIHIAKMEAAKADGLIEGSTKYIPTDLTEKIRNYKPSKIESAKLDSNKKTLEEMLDELYNIKTANKQWLINSIYTASQETEKLKAAGTLKPTDLTPLEALFLDQDLKNGGGNILGGLSKYKPGDILFESWGRQTEQKGYVTGLEAFKKLFMDSSIPEETKSHIKVLFGSGAGAWDTKAQDWKDIVKFFDWIKEYEGGKYAGNACYINGFLPNKASICGDYGVFTSIYEPCGLTYTEASTAGTPSISINTGGAPNLIKNYTGSNIDEATGFLTKDAFSSNISVLYNTTKEEARTIIKNKTKEIREELKANGEEIPSSETVRAMAKRQLRIEKLSEQVFDRIKTAIKVSDSPKDYKNIMLNNLILKIDWHENKWANPQNGNICALDAHLKQFGLERVGTEFAREGEKVVSYQQLFKEGGPLKSLNHVPPVSSKQVAAAYTPIVNETVKEIKHSFKITKTGAIGIIVAGALAALSGLVVYCDKYEKKAMEQNS